ncbi:DUF6230 family protein [Kitasatospora sp. NPDC048540]|uniref:DUF6230 family protein n=1 Tax=unclassified Kitasatospora TaxID=2633591 RepID=UPI00053A6AAD|nr:DUF6230 family protein [Kitasatospora sp. MBT63]
MSQTFGKTRWRRFAVVMVPSIAATAAIGVSLANSALAASFSVSGQSFKVTAADLDGTGFSQFGGVDFEANGTPHPVAISSFDHATIKGLCQSVVTDLGPLGKWTLVLNAGNGDKAVDAKQLLIDLNQLNADAEFTNINIGQDASTLPSGDGTALGKLKASGGKLPTGAQGFAQAADRAHLSGVQQTAWATSAGTFTLNGLKLNINKGSGAGVECY